MQTEKRFLIALVLTMGFLYLWFEYFVPKPKQQPKEVASPVETASERTPDPLGQTAETPPPLPLSEEPQAEPRQREEQITQTTPLFSLTWTNQPGTFHELQLTEFGQKAAAESDRVRVVPFQEEAELPLRWSFEVNGQLFSDDGATYELTRNRSDGVEYVRDLAEGLRIRKKFAWTQEGYLIEQEVVVENRTARAIKVEAATTLSSRETKKKKSGFFSALAMRGSPPRVSAFINEKAYHWTPDDVDDEDEIPRGEIQWAGLDSHYFMLVALPEEGRWQELKLANRVVTESGRRETDLILAYPPREISPGSSRSYKLNLFAGPKDIGLLRKVGSSLDRAIDLGDWLGPIARPMLIFLRWLHSLVPNFGIAIILLTFVVRLMMFPLAQMQARSMRKMQEHKPAMDALKEKLKDNKEAYSRELMGYMRNHKINPMGGCLLLLPQLPIFFALYRVLYNAIELRHAPFALWIQDLAAPDPYFVTPVLLGITMFVQQKMTPTPVSDPSQQAMMKVMPVMFSVFMLFLPAGLNLYILVSTLWGIVQQYWVQRDLKPVVVPTKKNKRNQSKG